MMIRPLILAIASLLVILPLESQEVWSLEQCIRHAVDNSLLVKQAEISRSFTAVNQREAKEARFPSLNGSGRAGSNFGRVINPSTNDFETENSIFNSWSLNSQVTLFGGNQINDAIRQASYELQAAQADLQQTREDIALQVALAYLNVLFADENLKNARAALVLSETQLTQIDKLIAAGARPEGERYDILAQIALDEQQEVNYENDYREGLLSLKQLLLLDPEYPLEVEKPEISLGDQEAYENYTFESVYNAALGSQPQISAQQMRIQSAELNEKIARANLYPTLSLGGSIGTNYSDLAMMITGTEVKRVLVPGVYIDDVPVQYEVEQEVPTGIEETPYFEQLDNNLGYGFGLTLQIPIYNNYRAQGSIERAQLTTLQEQTTDQQIRQTLKTDIQSALSAARSAREALKAAERAQEAADIAYTNAEKRFDLGALTTYELINARNRLESAVINVTIAKYDYLFRVKVIEYYLGRGLTLE